MPQGKMRTKAKLPESAKAKRKDKGPPVSKRGNAPAVSKRAKNVQVQKLKKIITKTVNATAEEQLRAVALDGKRTIFSKKEIVKAKASKSKNKKK